MENLVTDRVTEIESSVLESSGENDISAAIDKALEGERFSSEAAKRGIMAALREKEFVGESLEDEIIEAIGSIKKNDPSAFFVERKHRVVLPPRGKAVSQNDALREKLKGVMGIR